MQFEGQSPQTSWQRVFGGQVVGQALMAAERTVDDDRSPHSLHAYFLRAGDSALPIIYEVENLRDGGSFSSRRVTALQNDQAIYAMIVNFQKLEQGLEFFQPMPEAAEPDNLLPERLLRQQFMQNLSEAAAKRFSEPRPIEFRPLRPLQFVGVEASASRATWFRTAAAIGDDARLHRCVLAYASDMTLLDTAIAVHGKSVFSPNIQAASLDHAIWFHRPFRADEWLLYEQKAISTSGARGLAHGYIYDQAGTLVASVAQEGLIRPITQK
jgi:acyl-CoA thioesterase-2